MRSPRPWQPPIIEWLKQPQRDRCGLAVDKRLGKNYLTANWLAARNPKFALIVAPISAHAAWIEDLKADGFNPVLLEGSRAEKCEQLLNSVKSDEPAVFITNAEALYVSVPHRNKRIAQPTEIALLDWQFVVWDEFVVLANPKNRASEVAVDHLSKAPYKLMLSGEYIPQSIQQIYQPMKFLLGSFMGCNNFWRWRDQNFYQSGYDWIPKDTHGIRRAFAEHCYILSRKEAGIKEKPIFETRTCIMPDSIRMEYNRIGKNLVVELPEIIMCEPCNGKGWVLSRKTEEEDQCPYCFGDGWLDQRQTNLSMVTLNWLAQLSGGYPKDFPHLCSPHKLNLLREVVDEHQYEPLVVTYRFNDELYACYEALRKDKVRCEIMIGDTKPAMRSHLITAWSNGTGPRVILAQQKVMLYGMNMSACDTMVRYSLPYSWNQISQGMDRIVDTEKKRTLLYVNLCCKDTTDEAIVQEVSNNRGTSRLFMQRLKERVVNNIRISS